MCCKFQRILKNWLQNLLSLYRTLYPVKNASAQNYDLKKTSVSCHLISGVPNLSLAFKFPLKPGHQTCLTLNSCVSRTLVLETRDFVKSPENLH